MRSSARRPTSARLAGTSVARAARSQAPAERTSMLGSAPKRRAGTIRRVPEFLSPAWVEALDAALGTLAPTGEVGGAGAAAPDRFVLEQRVVLPDGSTHAHHVVASGGRFHAASGPAPAPDLVLTTSLHTAVAIQRGAVNAQYALAAGHLRLGGDLERLRTHAGLFGRLDDVFTELRATTTYPTYRRPGDPGGRGAATTASIAPMTISEADFRSEARAFLDANAERRVEETFEWGKGSDQVGLLEEKSAEQEADEVAAAKEWKATEFDAGFGWITGPGGVRGPRPPGRPRARLPRAGGRLRDPVPVDVRHRPGDGRAHDPRPRRPRGEGALPHGHVPG